MNYRPKILFIFSSLLGLIFYGTIGIANTQNVTATAQSKPTTLAGKTSSNNIHIDDIAIKISPDAQSGKKEDYDQLVSLLSYDAEKEISNWITWKLFIGVLPIFILLVGAGWTIIRAIIKDSVEKSIKTEIDRSNKFIDNAVSNLDKKREETIEVTAKVKHEIDLAQETLKEIRKKENEINTQLENFQDKIDAEVKNTDLIKVDFTSFARNYESKLKDEISRLEKKIKALKQIINKVDKDRRAESQVIDELILNLNSENDEVKYTATELLPQFDSESERIVDAFIDILKNNPDKKFELLLLIGLSELKGNTNKNLTYLLGAVDDYSNINILTIIGTLGNLGEPDKLSEIEKNKALASIVDKLLSILNNDLDSKEFAIDITASKVRSAIALALSCSGFEMVAEKAVPLLIKLLKDEDQGVRINAAIALGVIGKKAKKAKDAIPALKELENDESAEVRAAASEAIEKILQTA